MKTETETVELRATMRPPVLPSTTSTPDYATCDPSSLSPHCLECRCALCERTGGGIWLQLAALEGRVPLNAPICDAIPIVRALILDNMPVQASDAA